MSGGYVKKAWGNEDIIINEPEYCAKYLTVKPRWQCSLHKHYRKKETFTVLIGQVYIEVNGETKSYDVGKKVTILPGQWHRFKNLNKKEAVKLLEISMHHDDNDVTRTEPSRAMHEGE